jgi:phosphoglycerate dehydrogenase-like enzyme
VAQILLANKGFFYTSRPYSAGDKDTAYAIRKNALGNYGVTVGLIGVGQISRLVIRLLKNFHLKVKVCSRSLTAEGAAELGVERCSLEEIFATCQVVSNHLANNPSTVGTLREAHFASMLPYATFLNTGRGAQVVEEDLVRALTERFDLTAVLDVTHPEPSPAGHPFYSLPNCFMTPHIAGSLGGEVVRMAEYMVDEYERLTAGAPVKYEVTLKMLETMA